MNINPIHSGANSLETIHQAIANHEQIRRSPHVGNINPEELALILGLANLGASVQIELVDSIQGNDRYSNPHKVMTTSGEIPLCSTRSAKGRVVGACTATETVPVHGVEPGHSLQDFHLNAFTSILPPNVDVKSGSHLYADLGADLLAIVLNIAADEINREARFVDEAGKIQKIDCPVLDDLFGLGDNPMTGTLAPLEATMAIECILAAISSNGADRQVVHVAGPHMILYTKDPTVMGPVQRIASKVCAEIGLFHTTTIDYVLPGMSQLLANPGFPQVLPNRPVVSQYDMLEIV